MRNSTNLIPKQDQICAKRTREAKRRATAYTLHPKLRTDRLSNVRSLMQTYRYGNPQQRDAQAHQDSITSYIRFVEDEVMRLEQATAGFSEEVQTDGETIRRALTFLRTFGRIAVQDYSLLPDATRQPLVDLLKWEYRWCFAAAGTTPQVFKREIGRTGAR